MGVLYPDLSGAPISEEIMQNYEYNAQKTCKSNSKYAKVNRRSCQNQFASFQLYNETQSDMNQVMQNYEYNAQETWKTNSKYAKVNRRILQNI